MGDFNPTIFAITQKIIERSRITRKAYLDHLTAQKQSLGKNKVHRQCAPFSNRAHASAGCSSDVQASLNETEKRNYAIISSYNEMLSSAAALIGVPDILKARAKELGATAQFAAGVPAMCDGVTQGEEGMQFSLIHREWIAQATIVGLSHRMFEGGILLGDCDKIVPGLVIGALAFALPAVVVGSGPMATGQSNEEKANIRNLAKVGLAAPEQQFASELKSYGSKGVCTFYGTANTNNMLMEALGLHVPGSAFVNPDSPLRSKLDAYAIDLIHNNRTPIGEVLDERSFVNAIVALTATGGSTNNVIHITAMAKAAGIQLIPDDFDDISAVTPLLANVYSNGSPDINAFQAAGGSAFVIRELLDAGFMHRDVKTVTGGDLSDYAKTPVLDGDRLVWIDGPRESGDLAVLRAASEPYAATGGIRVIKGQIGDSSILAVAKISALAQKYRLVEAPVRVFDAPEAVEAAFHNKELYQDVVVVVRGQGPQSNSMPEMHKLITTLTAARNQDPTKTRQIALVTDGRLSGASGSIPAAIHVEPEATHDSWLNRLRDGDRLRIDFNAGSLELIGDSAEFNNREPAVYDVGWNFTAAGAQMAVPMLSNMRSASVGATFGDYRRNHIRSARVVSHANIVVS